MRDAGLGNRELLIGVVAVVALAADVDSFTLRHFPLGVLLSLFLYGHLHQKGCTYEQICYAAVAGFCGLLTIGYFVQSLLDTWHWAHWSERVYLVLVLLIGAAVFWVRSKWVYDSTSEGGQ